MKKYVCSVCGFIYQEGKWDDLEKDWTCPVCGAEKVEFIKEKTETKVIEPKEVEEQGLCFSEISAICSNLSKGCEKQYRKEESDLYNKLAQYFSNTNGAIEDKKFADILNMVKEDISAFPSAKSIASKNEDRGALRALVWSEKVTKVITSVLMRTEKNPKLLEGKNIYVCEICGFVYIGDESPKICPVCKVQSDKIRKIIRR